MASLNLSNVANAILNVLVDELLQQALEQGQNQPAGRCPIKKLIFNNADP